MYLIVIIIRHAFWPPIIPVRNIDGLNSRIHGHFARAPYFIILKLSDNRAAIEDFYSNEFLGEKRHVGVKVVRVIIEYKIDLLFISNIGEISFHMLKDNLVDIYKAEAGLTVQEIIESHHLSKLQPLTVPTHSVEESQVAK